MPKQTRHYRLADADVNLLAQLADAFGTNKTAALERIIREASDEYLAKARPFLSKQKVERFFKNLDRLMVEYGQTEESE